MTSSSPAPRPLGWLRALLPWALVGAGLVWLLGTFGPRRAMPEGEPAPPVQVALRGGGEFDLAAARGEVVVLNFWASWCPPCRAEAPVLARAHERLTREGGARVVGLAMDSRSVPFATRLGMTYPMGLVTPEIQAAYHVEMLPTTVVIDREGRIAWSYVGELRESELTEVLDEVLAQPAPSPTP
ncbi:MAG: TlpA family protein disulfide reductase [Sandaracinus sp.]|nr:TlpA family protein disulfide reductase [Sandaracinus sp.]MCB9613371.1 TlpA family protein disulfide reductase [Sandaracinus sp.]MCB9632140.1 TlpA family protein disulfide reductase [Sandaracinus sp.]